MSSKRQQKKTTGGTNAKPIVGGDLDPACYMIWARMSAREYWWPAYRCEESVHAPKKPAINTGAKEKGASGGAEDETETELVAFYTGRKKAGSTKTQHLMAWVDADDPPAPGFRTINNVSDPDVARLLRWKTEPDAWVHGYFEWDW